MKLDAEEYTSRGYRNKNPTGMWVEYQDKKNGKPFFYNLVCYFYVVVSI